MCMQVWFSPVLSVCTYIPFMYDCASAVTVLIKVMSVTSELTGDVNAACLHICEQ